MDALKAEIATKRKALDTSSNARPTKYMRRGELEKLKEEEERQAREEKAKVAREEDEKAAAVIASKSKAKAPSRSLTRSPFPSAPSPSSTPDLTDPTTSSELPKAPEFNISNEETIFRLRSKSQPIRLFGESDKDRRLRLRALELIEEKDHERLGGQNDFKKALEDVENAERELKAKASSSDGKTKGKKKDEEFAGILDLGLIKSDPDKLYPIIYYALKRTLKEWEEALEERPEHIKRATQGKLAAATQKQAADYLKPLLKLLRSRSLPADVLARIAEIVHYMQKRQYQRANDAYLRLSIGNAPWPIGVTMVGIHERSAREKISSDQVAHVLNDEVSRKYIQSLKRLLTFAQTKYPPDDATQRMG
ncbi:hypothetical protein JAAARDRAFT_61426 [Jaapia argillacea MUCL 33604]|uniref:Pre-mRNA-splicing factor 18 n=1 Tax=Jaapia argillacea MUCL 33604 TaxID=933084 RepID=A0A067PP88_9AGAM|nr:hypothetical protein JAAARDRAFT_61426 [Jaapia argillacea MUCL 33604]